MTDREEEGLSPAEAADLFWAPWFAALKWLMILMLVAAAMEVAGLV